MLPESRRAEEHRMNIKLYPGHPAAFGYSCQTWIAKQVNEVLHPKSYFCWFSKRFNAMANGDSSNPIWIYLILDRAVEQGDVNNAKVRDVRSNLLLAVERELRKAKRDSDIPAAMALITGADLEQFTPQVWKLKLDKIAEDRYDDVGQYPDEYRIRDLKRDDFEIIIE